MKLPRVRFKITPAEYSLLKPGFDQLAVGLVNANTGKFPGRHPWDRIRPDCADVYRDQAYNASMAEMVLSVRKKLWDLTFTRKVRMDVCELSAAALALRLFQPSDGALAGLLACPALARKLEMYRKRAKRAAEQKLGKADANVAMATWHRFVSWSRYNLLYSPASQKALLSQGFGYSRKKSWAAKRSALADMIRQVLDQRCYAALTEPQLKRVVRLLKEELRRRRHPFYLMELLNSNDEAGREFLFNVLSKKLELIPLAGAVVPEFVRAQERAEKFRDKSYRANPSEQTKLTMQTTAASHNEIQQPIDSTSSQQIPSGPSDSELIDAVALWFEENVDLVDRNLVGDLALNEALYNPPAHIYVPVTRVLIDLIAQTRPAIIDHSNRITPLATWVLTWLYVFRPYPQDVALLLDNGYRKLLSQFQLSTAA